MSDWTDQRIGALEKIVREYPNNVRARLILADLLARNGHKDRAIQHYGYLAELFIRDDHDVKAVALLKLILKLDPRNVATRETLARCLTKLNRMREAINHYRRLFSDYIIWGRKDLSLLSVHAILDIDPRNEWATSKLVQIAPAN